MFAEKKCLERAPNLMHATMEVKEDDGIVFVFYHCHPGYLFADEEEVKKLACTCDGEMIMVDCSREYCLLLHMPNFIVQYDSLRLLRSR